MYFPSAFFSVISSSVGIPFASTRATTLEL